MIPFWKAGSNRDMRSVPLALNVLSAFHFTFSSSASLVVLSGLLESPSDIIDLTARN